MSELLNAYKNGPHVIHPLPCPSSFVWRSGEIEVKTLLAIGGRSMRLRLKNNFVNCASEKFLCDFSFSRLLSLCTYIRTIYHAKVSLELEHCFWK